MTTTQTLFPSLAYDDAAAAVAWLHDAFGLVAGLVVPADGEAGGRGVIAHAELTTESGATILLLSTEASTRRRRSPRGLGGTAQSVYVHVDDADRAHERAVAAGAEVFNPLHETAYGSREFCCLDPEGHIWTFGTYRPGS